MASNYLINVSKLKNTKTELNAEARTFSNSVSSLNSSYLASTSDATVSSMYNKIKPLCTKINNGYDNILEWFGDYISNAEGLENYASENGALGAITEATVSSVASSKINGFDSFNVNIAGAFQEVSDNVNVNKTIYSDNYVSQASLDIADNSSVDEAGYDEVDVSQVIANIALCKEILATAGFPPEYIDKIMNGEMTYEEAFLELIKDEDFRRNQYRMQMLESVIGQTDKNTIEKQLADLDAQIAILENDPSKANSEELAILQTDREEIVDLLSQVDDLNRLKAEKYGDIHSFEDFEAYIEQLRLRKEELSKQINASDSLGDRLVYELINVISYKPGIQTIYTYEDENGLHISAEHPDNVTANAVNIQEVSLDDLLKTYGDNESFKQFKELFFDENSGYYLYSYTESQDNFILDLQGAINHPDPKSVDETNRLIEEYKQVCDDLNYATSTLEQINEQVEYQINNLDVYAYSEDFDENCTLMLDAKTDVVDIFNDAQISEDLYIAATGVRMGTQSLSKEDMVTALVCFLNDSLVYGAGEDRLGMKGYDFQVTSADTMLNNFVSWEGVMSDQEKQVLTFIYNTKGIDAAYDWMQDISHTLDERWKANEMKGDQAWAHKHHILASVRSLFYKPIEGVSGAVNSLKAKFTGGDIYYTDIYMSTDVQQQRVSLDISLDNGKLASFLYDITMSMANSGILIGTNIATGGVLAPFLTLSIMGAPSYTSALNAAKERGITDTRAILLALSSALIETATEHWTLGKFMGLEDLAKEFTQKFGAKFASATASKSFNRALTVIGTWAYTAISQGIAEGEEEFASSFFNRLADDLIAGDLSDYALSVEAYLNAGYSEGEAIKMANQDFGTELIMSFMGGFVSGLGFGTLPGLKTGVSYQNWAVTNTQADMILNEYNTANPDAQVSNYFEAINNVVQEINNNNADQVAKAEKVNTKPKIDAATQTKIDDLASNKLNTAMQNEPEITADLQFLEDETASLVGLEYRFKTAKSLARKIKTDADADNITYEEAVDGIHDALRYTLQIKDENYSSKVAEVMESLLSQGYQIRKFGNFWGNSEYQGINTQLISPDGYIFELQFHTEQSFYTKEKLNHKYYEIQRDENSTEAEKIEAAQKMVENQAKVHIPEGVQELDLNHFLKDQYVTLPEGSYSGTSPLITIGSLLEILADTNKFINLILNQSDTETMAAFASLYQTLKTKNYDLGLSDVERKRLDYIHDNYVKSQTISVPVHDFDAMFSITIGEMFDILNDDSKFTNAMSGENVQLLRAFVTLYEKIINNSIDLELSEKESTRLKALCREKLINEKISLYADPDITVQTITIGKLLEILSDKAQFNKIIETEDREYLDGFMKLKNTLLKTSYDLGISDEEMHRLDILYELGLHTILYSQISASSYLPDDVKTIKRVMETKTFFDNDLQLFYDYFNNRVMSSVGNDPLLVFTEEFRTALSLAEFIKADIDANFSKNIYQAYNNALKAIIQMNMDISESYFKVLVQDCTIDNAAIAYFDNYLKNHHNIDIDFPNIEYSDELPKSIKNRKLAAISHADKFFQSNSTGVYGSDQNISAQYITLTIENLAWLENEGDLKKYLVSKRGYTNKKASELISEIKKRGWLDTRTISVIIEYIYDYCNRTNRFDILSMLSSSFKISLNNEMVKRLQGKLVAAGMSLLEARRTLCAIDSAGVCSYASVVNSIFQRYENREADFKRDFGYDMFTTINGHKEFNGPEFLLDLYIFANSNRNLFNKNNPLFYYDGIGELHIGSPFNTENQVYLSKYGYKAIDTINAFLESKKAGLVYDSTIYTFAPEALKSTQASSKKNIDNIKAMIIDYIKANPNNCVELGVYADEKKKLFGSKVANPFPFFNPDGSLFENMEDGGHAVCVTGVSEDGLYVASWGKKLFIPFEALIKRRFTVHFTTLSRKTSS